MILNIVQIFLEKKRIDFNQFRYYYLLLLRQLLVIIIIMIIIMIVINIVIKSPV